MKAVLVASLLLFTTTFPVAGDSLFRHGDADYPHLDLTWQPVSGLGPSDHIWTHPLLPGVAALTGEQGIAVSSDGGTTWSVPAGLPVGAVGGIAFHPSKPGESLVALPSGLWRSQDGCRTYSKWTVAGLPPPTGVWYHLYDPLGRIIVVAHGDNAPGLSLTLDGGTTWQRLVPEYHVHGVLTFALGEKPLAVLAAPISDPGLRSLLYLSTLGEKPVETMHDCVIAGAAMPLHVGQMHFASPREGLLRLVAPKDDVIGIGGAEPVPIAHASDNGFSALDFSWGANADRQLLLLFDPYKLGLICNAGGAAWTAVGAGLPIGPMVKEGSQFRANANGSRFYAIINDQAFVGRPRDLRLDGLQLRVDPPVVLVQPNGYRLAVNALANGLTQFVKVADPIAAARDLRGVLDELDATLQPATLRLRATLAAGQVPKRLTLDLTRFGLSSAEQLFDDGGHDDGGAADGTWATEVRIRPNRLAPERDEWRRTPGILGLSVTAHWGDGARSGAVAPLLAWTLAERLNLSDRIDKPQERLALEGLTVSLTKTNNSGLDPEMRFVAKGGPWTVTMRFNYMFGFVDMGPFAKVGFDWSGGAAQFRLLDASMYNEPHESAEADIAGAVIGKPDAEGWCPVEMPVSSLIKEGSGFNRNRLVAFIFSGNAKDGEEFRLRAPCLLPEDRASSRRLVPEATLSAGHPATARASTAARPQPGDARRTGLAEISKARAQIKEGKLDGAIALLRQQLASSDALVKAAAGYQLARLLAVDKKGNPTPAQAQTEVLALAEPASVDLEDVREAEQALLLAQRAAECIKDTAAYERTQRRFLAEPLLSALKPDAHDDHAVRLGLLLEDGKRFSEARAIYEGQLERTDTELPRWRVLLAQLCKNEGKIEEAVAKCEDVFMAAADAGSFAIEAQRLIIESLAADPQRQAEAVLTWYEAAGNNPDAARKLGQILGGKDAQRVKAIADWYVFGSNGADGRPGTSDDLSDPKLGLQRAVYPKRAAAALAVQLASGAQARRRFALLLWAGQPAEAAAVARWWMGQVRSAAELGTVADALALCAVALSGDPGVRIPELQFIAFGPNGADGKPGTADDLKEPLPALTAFAPPPPLGEDALLLRRLRATAARFAGDDRISFPRPAAFGTLLRIDMLFDQRPQSEAILPWLRVLPVEVHEAMCAGRIAQDGNLAGLPGTFKQLDDAGGWTKQPDGVKARRKAWNDLCLSLRNGTSYRVAWP